MKTIKNKVSKTIDNKKIEPTKEIVFTKEQLVNSNKYRKYRDFISSIMNGSDTISIKELDIKIKNFYEKEIK